MINMRGVQTAVLLIVAVATSTLAMSPQYYTQYYTSRVVAGHGCEARTCGVNARCTISEGRPVCSCLNFYMGDPLFQCERVECHINEDCVGSRVCTDNRCTNPCPNLCGQNTDCQTRNHVSTCTCRHGFSGDPFIGCLVEDPQARCKPNPCGANMNCEVINGIATCSCVPGFRLTPNGEGCRHECESDNDCANHLFCSPSFKCESPCHCGSGAECEVVNHRAKCTCPKNWIGTPYVGCRPECTHHSECPAGKPACVGQTCVNLCATACGTNSNCELRGITPVCSCPKDMTGNPFVHCRPFTDEDLCAPHPCGHFAECRPGHDETGKKRPVCTCLQGYIGDPLTSCRRGECTTNNECPDNSACIDYACQNPCTAGYQDPCGSNAKCSPRNHVATCSCNDGYRGDAIYACNRIESRIANYRRSYRVYY